MDSSSTWIKPTLIGLGFLLLGTGAIVYQKYKPEAPGYLLPETISTSEKNTENNTEESLTIHVAGYIANPGIYKVKEGTRVMDILAMAGGPLPGADLDRLKLAAKLKDGQKIELKPLSSLSKSNLATSKTDSDPASSPLNLNEATAEELAHIPGIGKKSAEKIIQLRTELNGFKSIEDLKKLRGFSEKKIHSLKKHLTL